MLDGIGWLYGMVILFLNFLNFVLSGFVLLSFRVELVF